MKRMALLAAFVIGLAVVATPACSRNPATGGAKLKVAFISNNPYEFWTIARRGTEKAAAEFNVDVEFHMPARGTAAEQKQIIEDLLTKGVKGIAISPNDAENQAAFLNNEVASRVPLITQDSDLPAGSKRLCYIGTDNFEAGRAVGELVKQVLPDGGKLMIYVGKLDVQNALERRNGVLAALAGSKSADEAGKLAERPYPMSFGKYTVLGTMTDDAKQEKCKANVEDTLVKHRDIRCLVGLWAYNPPAMLQAVKDAKLEGKIALVGFDENEETLQGIKDGHIFATVVQNPFEFGYQAIRLLTKVAQGDSSVLPPNGILYVPHRIIKKDNVETFHAELKKLKG